jgi:hypothetical protein
MTDQEIDALLENARTLVRAKNDMAESNFDLGKFARYDYDLEKMRITFSNKSGKAKVSAHLVPIGTLAEKSETWMWSFENRSLPQNDRRLAEAMKIVTSNTGIEAFGAGFSPCDAALAWSLASVAAEELRAEAVYRANDGKSLLFLALNDIQKL